VGEDEADIRQNLIAITSPIARALIGKEEGDVVDVQAPVAACARTRSSPLTMRLARQLLLALLGGLLVTVGGLVAPTLFAILDDRATAGQIAASLLHVTNWAAIGLVVAVLATGGGTRLTRKALLALLSPAVLLAVNEWCLHPLIEAQSCAGTHTLAFAVLHGVSSAVYGLAALAAWAALVRELRAA
jgi:hypothetical protein